MTFRALTWQPDNGWHRDAAMKFIRAFGRAFGQAFDWNRESFDVTLNRMKG